MVDQRSIPQGWYRSRRDGDHHERYWDGAGWTARTRLQGFATAQQSPVPSPPPAPPRSSDFVGDAVPTGPRAGASAVSGGGGTPGFGGPAARGPGAAPVPGAAGYGPGQWYGGPPAMPRTNGLAIASLVLGILWLYWIGSLLAVVFGHVALRQVRRANGWQEGRGMAIAGAVLGWIGIAILAVLVIVGLAVADDLDDYDDDPYWGALATTEPDRAAITARAPGSNDMACDHAVVVHIA